MRHHKRAQDHLQPLDLIQPGQRSRLNDPCSYLLNSVIPTAADHRKKRWSAKWRNLLLNAFIDSRARLPHKGHGGCHMSFARDLLIREPARPTLEQLFRR